MVACKHCLFYRLSFSAFDFSTHRSLWLWLIQHRFVDLLIVTLKHSIRSSLRIVMKRMRLENCDTLLEGFIDLTTSWNRGISYLLLLLGLRSFRHWIVCLIDDWWSELRLFHFVGVYFSIMVLVVGMPCLCFPISVAAKQNFRCVAINNWVLLCIATAENTWLQVVMLHCFAVQMRFAGRTCFNGSHERIPPVDVLSHQTAVVFVVVKLSRLGIQFSFYKVFARWCFLAR